MSRRHLGQALAAVTAAIVMLVPIVFGAQLPGYSHTAQFISELGAVDMTAGRVVSLAGFLPIGLLGAAFLIVAAPLVGAGGGGRVGYALLFAVPLAYVGAALAPCDPGCPAGGSSRQQLHNLLGVAEYLGGGIGLLLLSAGGLRVTDRSVTRGLLALAGLVALAAFLAMAAPGLAPWRGLSQRLAEAALFGPLLLIAWRLTGGDPS